MTSPSKGDACVTPRSSRSLRHLRIEKNVAPLTLKSYAEDLESLLAYFQERLGQSPPAAEITVGILRGYISYLHECQYAKTTIARRLACLRTFFRYCLREGLVPSNPAKALRTPRAGRKLPHFLTAQQAAHLLETPPANRPMGLRDRAILETIYSAGLRVAEVVGINIADWDRDANVLRVRGKGRKESRLRRRELCRPRFESLDGGPETASFRSDADVPEQVRSPPHDCAASAGCSWVICRSRASAH